MIYDAESIADAVYSTASLDETVTHNGIEGLVREALLGPWTKIPG